MFGKKIMWKNWLKTTILVISISLLSACSSYGRSPSDTVKKYYDEVKNGEFNQAIDLVSDVAVGMWSESFIKTSMSKKQDKFQGSEFLEIKEKEVNGDIATVTYKIKLENGTEETFSNKLIKDDGEWLIIN